MHIRALTRSRPAPARNIEEVLDIISYVITIISQINSLIATISGKTS
jgi:hypothetical protein